MSRALASARRDPRFPPLEQEELAEIAIEVTVLSRPTLVRGPEEITIGRHGIILTKSGRRALFLPQVAIEQRWGLEETLRALARKAGLGPEGWRGATFHVFEGRVYAESRHN